MLITRHGYFNDDFTRLTDLQVSKYLNDWWASMEEQNKLLLMKNRKKYLFRVYVVNCFLGMR